MHSLGADPFQQTSVPAGQGAGIYPEWLLVSIWNGCWYLFGVAAGIYLKWLLVSIPSRSLV